MPAKPNAVKIGHMQCRTKGCGKRATVYQNVRSYLYVRCDACGTDQSNGAPAQVYFWQHLEAEPGAVVMRPVNVPESAGAIGCGLDGDPPVVVVETVSQVQQVPKGEPTGEPKGEQGKKGGKGPILVLIGLTAAGLAAIARAGS